MLQTCKSTIFEKFWKCGRWILPQRFSQSFRYLLRYRQSKFFMIQCDAKGIMGKSQKNCRNCCFCCTTFIDLARADTYAYIHLTGIPYCNAARQCQAVCQQTNLFSNNQTCIRLYRIAAQIFVVSLSVLFTFIIFKARTSYVSTIVLAVTVCTCYLMSTHFVDIHSNAGEGLVTCYLV